MQLIVAAALESPQADQPGISAGEKLEHDQLARRIFRRKDIVKHIWTWKDTAIAVFGASIGIVIVVSVIVPWLNEAQ
jgi:hypothetical protein